MCGFVTFINHGNKELLKESTELISHRGPDNQSIFWDEKFNSGLGHRRLSIIDLSSEEFIKPIIFDISSSVRTNFVCLSVFFKIKFYVLVIIGFLF